MGEDTTTVVSTTLEETLGGSDVTIARGDAVDVIARLKETSELPLADRPGAGTPEKPGAKKSLRSQGRHAPSGGGGLRTAWPVTLTGGG